VRFSEVFDVRRDSSDDWFDPVLDRDTPLYVDPLLVFQDTDPRWAGAHESVIEFFRLALDHVRRAEGDPESSDWQQALKLMTFPEPAEFTLGMAIASPLGHGTRDVVSARMVGALAAICQTPEAHLEYIEAFSIFVKGLGVDLISDILLDVLKSKFVEYTQDQCWKHGIALTAERIRPLCWDKRGWHNGKGALPHNPAIGRGVLLVPDRFLKDIPHVTDIGFFSWAKLRSAEQLRKELNIDLTARLKVSEQGDRARDVALRRPDLALAYVKENVDGHHQPYDVQSDPQLLVGWHEVGRQFADLERPPVPAPERDDFCDWVRGLMEEFKHAIEEQGGWKALNPPGGPVAEKIVQVIANMLFGASCKHAGVDLSREVDVGRGVVDFKFSAGWHRRALTEVKLLRSRQLLAGAKKQLPQYLLSEGISCGFYLCVGFNARDLSHDKLHKVRSACAELSEKVQYRIHPIFVDACPRKSASVLDR